MPLSNEAVTNAGTRAAVPAALLDLLRALLVFTATLSISTTGLQPPGWSGHLAVWLLASGIALAAVIRWGWVQCLPIYAADVVVDVLNRRPLELALLSGLGLPAGVLTTAWLLRRYGFHDTFERSRDMPLFIGAALAGMLIPAVVGVAVYASWNPIDPMENSPWGAIDVFRWWSTISWAC
jgi:hypothetical protein